MQNLRKNRNELDIIAAILKLTGSPKKKTHIMYKCNLSFRQTKEYLSRMTDLGLLEPSDNPGNEYKRTDKGTKFLGRYKDLIGFLE